MGKSWLLGLLTLTIALGLIGLLAYTSESIHRTAAPTPAITAPADARSRSDSVEREMGPIFHRNGLMLTH
jgi:hypothetical protein